MPAKTKAKPKADTDIHKRYEVQREIATLRVRLEHLERYEAEAKAIRKRLAELS